MKQRSTADGVDHEMPALTPDAAWKLWHQLVDLTNALWDAFEKEFLEEHTGKRKEGLRPAIAV